MYSSCIARWLLCVAKPLPCIAMPLPSIAMPFAALVLGCRYRLRIRYVVSAPNAADLGSRTDRLILKPVSLAKGIRAFSPVPLVDRPDVFFPLAAAIPESQLASSAAPAVSPPVTPEEPRRRLRGVRLAAPSGAARLPVFVSAAWGEGPAPVPSSELPKLPHALVRIIERVQSMVREDCGHCLPSSCSTALPTTSLHLRCMS